MKRIDHATVQRILDAAEIVDVVSDFVSLKRRGSNYIGLCPFHNERTPSFSVSPGRNYCKCFSCGKGGSPVGFLMELEKMSYSDALRYLAKKYHIEIEEHELTPEEQERQTERESMFAINEWALKYFCDVLNDTPDGRDIGKAYFLERGISEPMIEKFKLGYSLESYDAMYKAAIKQGFTQEYLVKTGLCAVTDKGNVYDRFRGRVIYPVFTVSGKVVAFGGRILSSDKSKAKYVNSPESTIYAKNRELYGLYQAKTSIVNRDRAYLVEGYMDVISMYQHGMTNVVASSGTSLTTGQIKLLRRFTKNVTVVYDTDAAGIKASLRGVDMLLSEGMDVKVLQFPDGDDPDSYARSHTDSELAEYISEHEQDFITFKRHILLDGAEHDPTKRAAAISDICRSIAVIPDLITRTVYISETSRALGIDEQVLSLQVKNQRAKDIEKAADEKLKQKARASLGNIEEETTVNTPTQPQQEQQQSPQAQTPANSRIARFEEEVLRYLVRYGMVKMTMLDPEQNKEYSFTVLEYVTQEMEYAGVNFSRSDVQAVYNLISEMARTSWPQDYAGFLSKLEVDAQGWLNEGRAEISSRLAEIGDKLGAEEKKLAADIERRRAEAINHFTADYMWLSLQSHPDTAIRTLATRVGADKHVLSNIHTRYGSIPTDIDRLMELVPRVMYEWQDAILDDRILAIDESIKSAQRDRLSVDAILDLMAEKQKLINIKAEFSQALGDRVYCPRHR